MKPTCIFIVFGRVVNEDFSNVKTIDTKVVPNIGEKIYFENTLHKVNDKVINYSQVEYHDINSPDRGKEMIYIFV